MLENDVQEYLLDRLGANRVFKAYNLYNTEEKPQPLFDMYLESAKRTLSVTGKKISDIGSIITIGDLYDKFVPSPATDLAAYLKMDKDVSTHHMQGIACSATTEALKVASANNILSEEKKDTLLLVSSYYTGMMLPQLSKIKKISMKDKNEINCFAYFTIFSDAVVSAYVTESEKKTCGDYSLLTDPLKAVTSKDNTPESVEKRAVSSVGSPNGFQVRISVDSSYLMRSRATLSKENIKKFREKFPGEFERAKSVAVHTAGKRFMDLVLNQAGIEKERASPSYEVLDRTGNTGPASILQVLDYSYRTGAVKKGESVIALDFGWDGADISEFKFD